MKILFLYHPYVNVGMTDALCAVSESFFCAPKPKAPLPENVRQMDFREFRTLQRRILNHEFDLIITYANREGLWRPGRSFVHNSIHATKKLLTKFPDFVVRLLLPTIKKSGTRLIVYDYDDLTVIPPTRNAFIDACQIYFKIHPAINLHKSFLFQTKRDGNVWNVLRNPQYTAWTKKIRPMSYGTDYKDSYDECLAPEKKYDVFFSGSTHHSPVRQEGRRLLEMLQAKGLRICLPEKVPHREFLRLCSESWLVLSPEGAEWQSARHYESLLMKSVPLINYPTVRLHQPLLDGIHAIFYPPEGDLLADVIHQALADKPRLIRISEQGRKHVLCHHIHTQLVQEMIRQADLLGNQ